MNPYSAFPLKPDSPAQPAPASAAANAAPRILLTATLRWPIAARLGAALAGLGCQVEVLCPSQHPASRTRAIRCTHANSTWKPLAALQAAIDVAAPDLIIPCDDNAAVHLHRLYEKSLGDPAAQGLRNLIVRSLGTPAACSLATTRGALMALAAQEGVRVPDTVTVDSADAFNALLSQHRLPAVLKIDSTWGGLGVAIVHHRDEARRAFAAMASRPSLLSALARLLIDRDPLPLLNAFKQPHRSVTLQDFITGSPANRAVACWQGQVLAGISVEAMQTQHPTGPATVVRVIDNPEMSQAVIRLVRGLGLSGLWGVDFVLEAATGAAYMIEMNPRATPICHLPLGAGRDLPVALLAPLLAQLAVRRASTPRPGIKSEVIAMFPGEWRRDASSAYLRSAYHDIPWGEPELVQDCIQRPWSERGWVARLWAHLRRRAPSAAAARCAASAFGGEGGHAAPGLVCGNEQTLCRAHPTTEVHTRRAGQPR